MEDFDFHFEWDPIKAAINSAKQSVDFATAMSVFRDPFAITLYDSDHSTTEETRWVTIGTASSGGCFVVIHTWDDIGINAAKVRIVSARKATRQEQRTHEEGT